MQQQTGRPRSSTLESRLKMIADLSSSSRSQPLSEQTVSVIIHQTADLLKKNQPNEVRHKVWQQYATLVSGRADTLGQLRFIFFELIKKHDEHVEDIPLRMDLLMALTNGGKHIQNYEANIADFMVRFCSKISEKRNAAELESKRSLTELQRNFLSFMINLVKYNAASLASNQQQALSLMVQYACQMVLQTKVVAELDKIYEFLHVVISYSHLPKDCLAQFVIVLCIGVNDKDLYTRCQQIMRSLLGTYLGFAALITLQHLIEDETNYTQNSLIRGAVYFLVNVLWDDLCPKQWSLSPSSVLLAFKNLIVNDVITSPYIILEVANGINTFLNNLHSPLNRRHEGRSIISQFLLEPKSEHSYSYADKIVFNATWELMIDICYTLVSGIYLKNPRYNESNGAMELKSMVQIMVKSLFALLEKLFDNDKSYTLNNFTTTLDQSRPSCQSPTSVILLWDKDLHLFKLFSPLEVAVTIGFLSDESICKLIRYKLKFFENNLHNTNIYSELSKMIEVFLVSCSNRDIRCQFLKDLQTFLETNHLYINVDTFWEKVAMSYFTKTSEGRELGVEFVIYITKKCNSYKPLSEMVDLLESIATQHLKMLTRQHSVTEVAAAQQHAHSRGLYHQSHSAPHNPEYSSPGDFVQPIQGLIGVFVNKMDHPMCHMVAIKAFITVIKLYSQYLQESPEDLHLNAHAYNTRTRKSITKVKELLFPTILSLRSNSLGQLGIVLQQLLPEWGSNSLLHRTQNKDERVKFSPYVLLADQQSGSSSPSTANLMHQPIQRQPSLANTSTTATTTTTTTTTYSLNVCLYDALLLVLNCIEKETGWSVLESVFSRLAIMLKSKKFILSLSMQHSATAQSVVDRNSTSATGADDVFLPPRAFPDQLVVVLEKFIDSLQTRLGSIEFDQKHIVTNAEKKVERLSKADVLAYPYKCLIQLVGYPLTSTIQTSIVKCLKNGLVNFSSKVHFLRQCIIALTLCMMEIPATMSKGNTLTDIIIALSKISTHKTLAVAKLEFLTNIVLFPDLYASFTEKQFLSIFMIALQYICPFSSLYPDAPRRYNEYTVVLALRVISFWFLRCPTSYRPSLMKFLTKGLYTNVLKDKDKDKEITNTLQASSRMPSTNSVNIDSRSRMSESSRLSIASSPPPAPATPVTASSQFSFSFQNSPAVQFDQHQQHPLSSSSSAFAVYPTSSMSHVPTEGLILDPNNQEVSKIGLVEVCMDMFAAHVFNTSSPLPLKPSMINKLLDRQRSMLWVVGHKIIQITTTGCTSRAYRNGLCSKCYYTCHMNQRDPNEVQSPFSFNNNVGSSQSIHWQQREQHAFVSQISYDANNKTATNTSSLQSSFRRRHRSEMVSTKNGTSTNDDLLVKRSPGAQIVSSESDLNVSRVDNRYCICWCQSWAEIVVRRSTGNTRFVMKVENNLGDFLYWSHSKAEHDSLADMFAHYDPETSFGLNSQNVRLDMESIELDSVTNKHNTNESVEKPRTLNAVTRAASFGSRRASFQPSPSEQQQANTHTDATTVTATGYEQIRSQIHRRLEKNPSFEEDDPPSLLSEGNNQQPASRQMSSPVASTSSSDTVTTEKQFNSQVSNFRERSTTITVMTPVQKSASSSGVSVSQTGNIAAKSASTQSLASNRLPLSSGALSPQSVFLQLFYNSSFRELAEVTANEKPILLDKNNDATKFGLRSLDRITPYETHKIGVLYVGAGQECSKTKILANQMGSYRYTTFLKQLGQLVKLEDIDSNVCYTGGLDAQQDGPFALSWGDHMVQAIFHVATSMPNLANDPKCNNKLAHIGNDFVCIVYNNSGQPFEASTIKGDGQFLQVMVVITPLELESNIVEIQAKSDLIDLIGHSEWHIVSDHSLPTFVRQLALHANLAAMVSHKSANHKSYNVYNWMSRLNNIKRIRSRGLETASPLYNPELIYPVRSSAFPTNAQQHKLRLGAVPSQSSRDDSDSVISSSVASPAIPGSASSTGTFDYDPIIRLAFPDFMEFAKE